ncbi:MAG: hypothetical protein PVJ19_08975 [Desulfobacteraceae bacterium]|jgi:hypothetical protein
MNENNETNHNNDALVNLEQGFYDINQRSQDRRSSPSEGFTYISSVGWIDRREKLRRDDDPCQF